MYYSSPLLQHSRAAFAGCPTSVATVVLLHVALTAQLHSRTHESCVIFNMILSSIEDIEITYRDDVYNGNAVLRFKSYLNVLKVQE